MTEAQQHASGQPWLSVITVVKDDPSGYERSLRSLLEQDLVGVEFVVIDSSSTPVALPEGQSVLGFSTKLQWMPPAGIYAAMNEGLAAASGEFVYFLNAGDEFAGIQVLLQVKQLLAGSAAVWAFGPVVIEMADGMRVITPKWDYERERALGFSRGHFPSHQGTFVRRKELERIGGFDLEFDIAADYATCLKLSLVAAPIELPVSIAVFREGGISTRNWQSSFRQFHQARLEILHPTGTDALVQRLYAVRQYLLVYASRRVRPALQSLSRTRK